MKHIDPAWKQHATTKQNIFIDSVLKYGSIIEASKHLHVGVSSISRSIASAEHRFHKSNNPDNNCDKCKTGEKWLIIPDTQVRPDKDMTYMYCIGKYIVDKKPDRIIHLGDFEDMHSLSSYDRGRRSFEGARYKNDIEAGNTANQILWWALNEYNNERKAKNRSQYNPHKYLLGGNHGEGRIEKITQTNSELHGLISVDDVKYQKFGWNYIPFLEVLVINGVAFSHYFPSGTMGRPCGTAQAQLNKMHMSCVSGHQQGRQTATSKRADGRQITSIIAGSAYDFECDYLGPQGNKHWRGVIMLHNVHDGEFDEVYVPLDYLKSRYAKGLSPMVMSPESLVH